MSICRDKHFRSGMHHISKIRETTVMCIVKWQAAARINSCCTAVETERLSLLTHLLPVADTVFNLLDRVECLTT